MATMYNDGLLPGGRTPKLWIVHNGTIHSFTGADIPGVAAVTETAYEKGGKWSNTTYHIELAAGATACRLVAPLHGRVWPENDRLAAYERFLQEFSVAVSFEKFDNALLRDYPAAHARMLEGEASLASLAGDASELVEISTSQSCRRNPHTDVRITAPDGRSWVVAHESTACEITGVARLTDRKHRPGMRGGVTTLTFAVAPGVVVALEHYEKDGEAHEWALGRGGDGTAPSFVRA